MTHSQLQERTGGLPSSRPAPAIPSARTSATAGIFDSLGDQLKAIALHISSQRTSAPIRDPRIDLLELRAAAGSSETIPSDGGLLVQPEFAQTLIQNVVSASPFLSRCRRFPITIENGSGVKLPAFAESSRADGQRWGGVQSYWVGEAQAAPLSMPKYRLMELVLKKLMAFTYATSETLADAALLNVALEDAVVGELKFKAEYAALFGDGTFSPLGCLNVGNPALITVAAESGQSPATIIAANIEAMYSRMWVPSRARACWFVNGDLEAQLAKLTIAVGTSGGSALPLFQYSEDPDNQPYNLLMGRPVIPLEYMPTLGTAGDISFLDPGEYLIASKGGINGASSLHVLFNADQQCFRWRWRLDGQPLWDSPIVPFNAGATQSPFITLAARS